MGQDIDVSYAAVRQAQQDIRRTAENIEDQLRQLDDGLKPLVATWTGAAAEAYQQKHQDWVAAAKDLNRVLHDVSRAVEDAHDLYRRTDRTLGDQWQR